MLYQPITGYNRLRAVELWRSWMDQRQSLCYSIFHPWTLTAYVFNSDTLRVCVKFDVAVTRCRKFEGDFPSPPTSRWGGMIAYRAVPSTITSTVSIFCIEEGPISACLLYCSSVPRSAFIMGRDALSIFKQQAESKKLACAWVAAGCWWIHLERKGYFLPIIYFFGLFSSFDHLYVL